MDRSDILEQLRRPDPQELFARADSVRKKNCGEKVYLRGIIEFSNNCCRDCAYCGLRRSNKHCQRYRLEPEQIVTLASDIGRAGIKTIILQSGDDFDNRTAGLVSLIKAIKARVPGAAVTLSLGERPTDDYRAFFEAGADRYLLKHETLNEELYRRLHPGQESKTRLKILEKLRDIGYQVGTGNIVGLPGQTDADLAADLLFLRDYEPDMAGIGPFIPQRDTPLAAERAGSLELTLKVLALARILLPRTHLPATTALASLSPDDGQWLGLKAGANVIMPSFTPEGSRRNYAIYDNRIKVGLDRVRQTVARAGRTCSGERGDSLRPARSV